MQYDTIKPPHTSVLTQAVLETFAFLKSHKNPLLLDCTLGFGGHTKALLQAHPTLRVIATDKDTQALNLAKHNLSEFSNRVEFFKSPFSSALSLLDSKSHLLGILADIGVSSMQLDDKHRGFSFESDNLDMRMDADSQTNAKDLVNSASVSELEKILSSFGEIRESRKLAQAIVEFRKQKPITSARELATLVAKNISRQKSLNPATLAFQALRIAVNDELGELERLLDSIHDNHTSLKGAKVCIISFHSLEDRIIKSAFKQWSKECICLPHVMKCECGANNALGIASKKPIIPSPQEIATNKRARSAKMRVFQFKN